MYYCPSGPGGDGRKKDYFLVLVGPFAGLEPPVHQDLPALVKIGAKEIGGAAPRHDIEKVRLAFAVTVGIVTLHGNSRVANGNPAGGLAEFGKGAQTAHDSHLVQHTFTLTFTKFLELITRS